MELGTIVRQILMPILAAGLAILLSIFGQLRRHSNAARYALRNRWFKLMLAMNSLMSIAVYHCLYDMANRLYPTASDPFLTSLSLSIASALISVEALKKLPVIEKAEVTKPGWTIVTLGNWMKATIQQEIDRLVGQKVTEVSIQIKRSRVPITTLEDIGYFLVSQVCRDRKNMLASLRGRIAYLASSDDLSGLIWYLTSSGYCEPEWLLEQVMKNSCLGASDPATDVDMGGDDGNKEDTSTNDTDAT